MDVKTILANPIVNVVNLALAVIGMGIAVAFSFEGKREGEQIFLNLLKSIRNLRSKSWSRLFEKVVDP